MHRSVKQGCLHEAVSSTILTRMPDADTSVQLVAFRLGDEHYAIDIMDVEGIVRVDDVRAIPNAPSYVEGIINLRGEIIPVISLHKRFHLAHPELSEEERSLGGFVIIDVNDRHVAIMIDVISRVVTIAQSDIQPPPQVITGIGSEYIEGVVSRDDRFLIILDIRRLFSANELQQLEQLQR